MTEKKAGMTGWVLEGQQREKQHPHLSPPPSRGRRCCELILPSKGRKYKDSQ